MPTREPVQHPKTLTEAMALLGPTGKVSIAADAEEAAFRITVESGEQPALMRGDFLVGFKEAEWDHFDIVLERICESASQARALRSAAR